MNMTPEFYADKDIAKILNMSPEWVRGQRHRRKHGLPCILDLEPRYIGACPRYSRDDVEAFVAALKG
ncbi:helix-turn-helix domain-containing protein [Sphingomonas sp. BGYR3]|uniref:helix-turn-helix domain-containing protein n=1 Tax=Sphingomonas sp. BGYR3 TaxID=2975483 RepID=UPI0021A34010|nr:helix-turn-helix domain-containing protein [Sphingomonas sp. BGYR3]MDG5489062.1 helix-turn-helix domain-containing protein [Sphingomonas sp. BGYR3]